MASIGAVLVIFTMLLAAPLALGSFVIAQSASRRVLFVWFGFLTALLIVALILGAISLFTLR